MKALGGHQARSPTEGNGTAGLCSARAQLGVPTWGPLGRRGRGPPPPTVGRPANSPRGAAACLSGPWPVWCREGGARPGTPRRTQPHLCVGSPPRRRRPAFFGAHVRARSGRGPGDPTLVSRAAELPPACALRSRTAGSGRWLCPRPLALGLLPGPALRVGGWVGGQLPFPPSSPRPPPPCPPPSAWPGPRPGSGWPRAGPGPRRPGRGR